MTLNLDTVKGTYFQKLFQKPNSQLSSALKGKVLLVDKHTMPIILMSYSQLELLEQDVILVELLENRASLSTMSHLNCVIFVKPTKELVGLLAAELATPHYNHYLVFFNNAASKQDIEKAAEADAHEVVLLMVELFQDYLIAAANLFTISVDNLPKNQATVAESALLASVLLSLRKCPVIKYENGLLETKRLALEMLYHINLNLNNNLFDDVQMKLEVPPVLLIVDRKSDPITPLVLPWTYQLMIHELLGINRNVVQLEELMPLLDSDTFFQELKYLNYGDLTDKFQKFVDDYKKQTKQLLIENIKTQDLAELKRLLTRFPEFKKLSGNVLRHLNLISAIDKKISKDNLWAVGELQQTITCGLENHQTIRTRLGSIVADSGISTENKVKLLILYAAKFPENKGDLQAMVTKLQDPVTTNPPPTVSQLKLISHFGNFFRVKPLQPPDTNIGGLFSKNRIKIQQLFNLAPENLSSVPKTDNIFMQYVPPLSLLLSALTHPTPENKPDLTTLTPDVVSAQYGSASYPAQEIIVYFKGGATYEETRLIHDLHTVNNRVSYVLGGDTILNSDQWLEKMCDIVNAPEQTPSATSGRQQLRDLL